MNYTSNTLTVALFFTALFSASVHAADISISATPPAIDGGDIANLGQPVVNTDKWWPENSTGAGSVTGQTFTTGPLKVRFKAITYQVHATQQAEPEKVYVIRVGSVDGDEITVLHTESATQTNTWNSSEYMTWELDTPVLLEANETYGVDVGIISSTSGWRSGIPYIDYTGDHYAGGWRYTSGRNGVGEPLLNLITNQDRVFHIDLEYPPQGFQFILK
jgi:hypothetical protein